MGRGRCSRALRIKRRLYPQRFERPQGKCPTPSPPYSNKVKGLLGLLFGHKPLESGLVFPAGGTCRGVSVRPSSPHPSGCAATSLLARAGPGPLSTAAEGVWNGGLRHDHPCHAARWRGRVPASPAAWQEWATRGRRRGRRGRRSRGERSPGRGGVRICFPSLSHRPRQRPGGCRVTSRSGAAGRAVRGQACGRGPPEQEAAGTARAVLRAGS